MKVTRTNLTLRPDAARVLFRLFVPGSSERITRIIGRVMALTDDAVSSELHAVTADFRGRHQDLTAFFHRSYEQVRTHVLTDNPLSSDRQQLIGAYFTQEYSLESSALFNPSIVWHPDQRNVPAGARRFIMSLRAIGEGHVSSITFRTGLLHPDLRIEIDPVSPCVIPPAIVLNPNYERPLFARKLAELGLDNQYTAHVLDQLEENFSFHQLEHAIRSLRSLHHVSPRITDETARHVIALARANYQLTYPAASTLTQRIIFPSSPAETNGIEDARFVRFTEDDGDVTYYATYTAYDGRVIMPQLLATRDFRDFRVSTLNGPQAQQKGMALFPRRVHGLYTMLSRQDNENLYLMVSDNLNFWYERQLLLRPTQPWEFVQLGNCGSPLETDAGWLVLTHGVGPVRKYRIGAILLDRDDPTRVIGRLREPLLSPEGNEREGYVPNVVYSCGAILWQDHVVIPYAMADYATTFATVPLSDLIEAMDKPSA